MKTIKQLADELGIDKQKVYRYVKKYHINDVHRDADVMYIDDVLETLIKSHFSEKTASDEVHHEAHQSASNDAVNDALISMLQRELDAKNRQIEHLQKLLDQEQQLRMITEKQLLQLEEHPDPDPSESGRKWWQFWK